jgi:hypothetical protein
MNTVYTQLIDNDIYRQPLNNPFSVKGACIYELAVMRGRASGK